MLLNKEQPSPLLTHLCNDMQSYYRVCYAVCIQHLTFALLFMHFIITKGKMWQKCLDQSERARNLVEKASRHMLFSMQVHKLSKCSRQQYMHIHSKSGNDASFFFSFSSKKKQKNSRNWSTEWSGSVIRFCVWQFRSVKQFDFNIHVNKYID